MRNKNNNNSDNNYNNNKRRKELVSFIIREYPSPGQFFSIDCYLPLNNQKWSLLIPITKVS